MAVSLSTDHKVYATFPIVKMEETDDGLMVYGKATDGRVDADDQIVDPEWSGAALGKWLHSGGNVRVQHNPQLYPAGKGLSLEIDRDGDGGHWVKSLIVEPTAQKLVRHGVLRAYSIGISRPVIRRDTTGKARGGIVTGNDNTEVAEVSLVDRPANSGCGITLAKGVDDGDAPWSYGDFEDLLAKAEAADLAKTDPDDDGDVDEPGMPDDDKPDDEQDEPDTDEVHKSYRAARDEWLAREPRPNYGDHPTTSGTAFLAKMAARDQWQAWDAEGEENGFDSFTAWCAKRDMDPNVGGGVDRDKIPDDDFVDREGRRFPIVTPGDVPDAVSSYGRAEPQIPMKNFKRRLTAIAHRKGPEFVAALPESWAGKNITTTAPNATGLVPYNLATGPAGKDDDKDDIMESDLTKAGAKKCPNCGTEHHADSKLRRCDSCGKKLPRADKAMAADLEKAVNSMGHTIGQHHWKHGWIWQGPGLPSAAHAHIAAHHGAMAEGKFAEATGHLHQAAAAADSAGHADAAAKIRAKAAELASSAKTRTGRMGAADRAFHEHAQIAHRGVSGHYGPEGARYYPMHQEYADRTQEPISRRRPASQSPRRARAGKSADVDVAKVGPGGWSHGWRKDGAMATETKHGTQALSEAMKMHSEGKGHGEIAAHLDRKATELAGTKVTHEHLISPHSTNPKRAKSRDVERLRHLAGSYAQDANLKSAGGADMIKGKKRRLLPPDASPAGEHREPDGDAVEALEADAGMSTTPDATPDDVPASVKRKKKGKPFPGAAAPFGSADGDGPDDEDEDDNAATAEKSYAAVRMHDALCPAYSWPTVTAHYPALTIPTDAIQPMWFADAAAKSADPAPWQLLHANAVELVNGYGGAELQTDARAELRKAFADMYPTAHPTPTMITPGQFKRPYINAGHAPLSAPANPGADIPPASHVIHPDEFTRPLITEGHQAEAPGDVGDNLDTGGSLASGASRTFYRNASRDAARNAMAAMHDHIAQTFPDMCPMSTSKAIMPPDMGAVNRPTPTVVRDVGKAPGEKAAKAGLTKAQIAGLVKTAVDEHTATLRGEYETRLAKLQVELDELGAQPDPAQAPLRGVVRKAATEPEPVQRVSLVEKAQRHAEAERAEYVSYLRGLASDRNPNLHQREQAESVLEKMLTP